MEIITRLVIICPGGEAGEEVEKKHGEGVEMSGGERGRGNSS